MLSPRLLLLAAALALLPAIARPARNQIQPPAKAKEQGAPAATTLAIADFAGADKEIGRFIAETLLTNLAQSDKLRVAERAALNQLLTELKLQHTGVANPGQVKRLGQLAGVDFLIVGSYLERGEALILNARLLDIRTGLVVRGGSAQTTGAKANLLGVSHSLARLFHRRLTGTDLPPADDTEVEVKKPEPGPRVVTHQEPPAKPVEAESPSKPESIIPAGAQPNGILRETDLTAVCARITRRVDARTHVPVTVMEPAAPVTRLRALAALVKIFASQQAIQDAPATKELPPDWSEGPAWGKLYVAAAVDRGWWPASKPLRPRETATWTFVEALLNRMPVGELRAAAEVARKDEQPPDPDAPTGLIVDARDLDVQRSMSMRILDQQGRLVYPEAEHMPDPDWLQDHGTASYPKSIRDANRAGARPMIVRAVGVYGPGRDDLVVSNYIADKIKELNRRGKFLATFKVCVIMRGDFPGYGAE